MKRSSSTFIKLKLIEKTQEYKMKHQEEDLKKLWQLPVNFLVILIMITSCGYEQQQPDHEMKEAWSNSHRPEILTGSDTEFEFASLPLEGHSTIKGWSDDYWPSYRGGISYRWHERSSFYSLPSQDQLDYIDISRLSPAEKYDIYMGRLDFPTVYAEQSRTQVMRTNRQSPLYDEGFDIPSWFGLCHGWAPAALNFQQPNPITVTGIGGIEVPFGASDIKALLTYYQQYKGNRSVRNYFMSERCNESFQKLDEMLESGQISQEEYHQRRDGGSCKGINAGSFHLVLANEIGIKKQSFIADVTRDAEVWNYPVHFFRSEILEESYGASEDAAPGTIRELRVKTEIEHSVSTLARWSAFEPAVKQRTYEYILEIDALGNIIGGEWISTDRPDFLWRQTTPEFRGFFRPLEYLYEQSILPAQ